MTRLEEMVIAAIPTARPGVDFSFTTDENGHADLSHWDDLKLGPRPSLEMLRNHFMRYLANKQRVIPTIDMTDPCPWLDQHEFEPEPASVATARNVVEMENGERYVLTPGGAVLHYRGDNAKRFSDNT